MNGDTGVLIGISTTLGGDCVGSVRRITSVDVAVLEDYCCIAENEIDCAVDVAVFVELTVGVNVESVLVAFKAALVEY